MPYVDLLLATLTYPDPPTDRALRSGVALAARLGGAVTVLAVTADIPRLHNPLANAAVHLDQLSDAEEAESVAVAHHQAACARTAAELAGVPIRTETIKARLYEETSPVAKAARTYDLTLLPIGAAPPADRALAEAVLFGSGRPAIVFPEAREISPASQFETIVIGWDGGRAASRAVADAIPLLRRARAVHLIVVLGDKPDTTAGVGPDLLRHLAAHGVDATLEQERKDHRSVGRFFADTVAAKEADLLVMGGFGRTRLREFVLGGTTDTILQAPPCAVLLSH